MLLIINTYKTRLIYLWRFNKVNGSTASLIHTQRRRPVLWSPIVTDHAVFTFIPRWKILKWWRQGSDAQREFWTCACDYFINKIRAVQSDLRWTGVNPVTSFQNLKGPQYKISQMLLCTELRKWHHRVLCVSVLVNFRFTFVSRPLSAPSENCVFVVGKHTETRRINSVWHDSHRTPRTRTRTTLNKFSFQASGTQIQPRDWVQSSF